MAGGGEAINYITTFHTSTFIPASRLAGWWLGSEVINYNTALPEPPKPSLQPVGSLVGGWGGGGWGYQLQYTFHTWATWAFITASRLPGWWLGEWGYQLHVSIPQPSYQPAGSLVDGWGSEVINYMFPYLNLHSSLQTRWLMAGGGGGWGYQLHYSFSYLSLHTNQQARWLMARGVRLSIT